jgi:hypothetical protein
MANALYGKGRQHILAGDILWASQTIKAGLVDAADYTPVIDTHEYISDVAAAGRVPAALANWATLTTKTNVLGVADADDALLTAVTGDPCELILLYYHTGTENTSILLALWDTFTGNPVTPNGGNITIQWDNTPATKIFKL